MGCAGVCCVFECVCISVSAVWWHKQFCCCDITFILESHFPVAQPLYFLPHATSFSLKPAETCRKTCADLVRSKTTTWKRKNVFRFYSCPLVVTDSRTHFSDTSEWQWGKVSLLWIQSILTETLLKPAAIGWFSTVWTITRFSCSKHASKQESVTSTWFCLDKCVCCQRPGCQINSLRVLVRIFHYWNRLYLAMVVMVNDQRRLLDGFEGSRPARQSTWQSVAGPRGRMLQFLQHCLVSSCLQKTMNFWCFRSAKDSLLKW